MKIAKQIPTLLVFFIAATSLGAAQAAVVVSQPLDPTKAGEYSNLGPSNQQVADDFTLSLAATLDSVTWYGRYDDPALGVPNPTDFAIRFFDDNAGTPEVAPILSLTVSAAPVVSGSFYTDVAGAQIPWYEYTAALPGLSLAADTFWLSIVEDDAGTTPSGTTQWLWADTSTAGLRSFRNADGQPWNTGLDTDHAYSLSGTVVPVPAAVWLFGTAMVGLAGFGRRRKVL